jgi:acetyl esterase/lipase
MTNPQSPRAGRPASADLAARRARIPATVDDSALQPGTTIQETKIGGIACLECEPIEPKRTILYFHGGGYRMGSPAAWAGFAARLAVSGNARVVVPDYSLAPEHPFPAALYDGITVYNALSRARREAPIAAGDSAGGGLAAALALACRLIGFPMPKALVLLSPWLDLACPDRGMPGNTAQTDPLFPRKAAMEAAVQYLQGHDAADPLVSPLKGDLAGLPPVLLLASSAEYLLGDVLAFQSRLAQSNVTVQSFIRPGLQHAWPVITPEAPEAHSAFDLIGHFIEQMHGSASPTSTPE